MILGGRKQAATRSLAFGFLLLAALLFSPAPAQGDTPDDSYSVVISWDAISDPAIAGYRIYYGTNSGDYYRNISLGNHSSATVPGLTLGVTYYFAVTVYDSNGLESDFSDEIIYTRGVSTVALRPTADQQFGLTVSGLNNHNYDVEATTDFLTWTVIGTVTTDANGTTEFTDPDAAQFPARFYRTHSAPEPSTRNNHET